MKKIITSALIVFSLFSFIVTTQAQDKGPAPGVVNISCPGGGLFLDNQHAIICSTQTVTFKMETSSCDSVKIVGVAPIDSFWLKVSNPQQIKTFIIPGKYDYRVTKATGTDTARGDVRVIGGSNCTPTMTEWGIIILIGLFIGSAIFIMLKRRKATVPA